MEFNQLINRYLVRDPDSRKRNLHIRTYGVIPLNEDCGLIEWIPNLIGLRFAINRIYRERGCLMSNTELRKRTPNVRETIVRKRELFEKGLSFCCCLKLTLSLRLLFCYFRNPATVSFRV
jgi:serine/threonine-protein kinase ATR